MRGDCERDPARPGFFIPPGLIDYEYFDTQPISGEQKQEREPFQREIELAFFMTEFGLSKRDYEDLTPAEIAFIMKAWEEKTVRNTTYIRDAVYNATINANRKKRARFIKLWRKTGKIKEDKVQDYKEKITKIEDIEKAEGKSWLEKVFAGAGIKNKRNKKEKSGGKK